MYHNRYAYPFHQTTVKQDFRQTQNLFRWSYTRSLKILPFLPVSYPADTWHRYAFCCYPYRRHYARYYQSAPVAKEKQRAWYIEYLLPLLRLCRPVPQSSETGLTADRFPPAVRYLTVDQFRHHDLLCRVYDAVHLRYPEHLIFCFHLLRYPLSLLHLSGQKLHSLLCLLLYH